MNSVPINALLNNLKDNEQKVRESAVRELWQRWFEQKGILGVQLLNRSRLLIEAGDTDQAEMVLTQLIESMPDFAEAWNQRAILYFMEHRYRKSVSDCQQTTRLNPFHFGALHGMGLSHLRLQEYGLAAQAFRQVLELQPHSVENQRMLLECMAHL
ncbi:MAG: tetratricopeptide repeat protein [Alkalinema sp. FL-bin-369]|nr:tetratricopeptide repeat protein [Leptolyngbyaceae cyanobacterium LF-bin-369]